MNDLDDLTAFAKRYAEAWCSQDPEKVAAFYAKGGSISVNGGPPATIIEVAPGFLRDFPDMVVMFDKLEPRGKSIAFHWTLIGTNAGPGGTGNRVRISGYELWRVDNNGLLADSRGHFDNAEYERKLKYGVHTCRGA